MKTFEMLIDDELLDGVFGIGLVQKPAIESDFLFLSKVDEKQNLHLDINLSKINEEQKIVTGPILIPNKTILRIDPETKEKYNIFFSKETIKKVSQNFLMNNYKDNITIDHEIKVNKVNLVESWYVEDPIKDKSNFLNLKIDAGTWMGSFKIKDDYLWNEFIKSGILKGFSIEGHFTYKNMNMSDINSDFNIEIRNIISKLINNKKNKQL